MHHSARNFAPNLCRDVRKWLKKLVQKHIILSVAGSNIDNSVWKKVKTKKNNSKLDRKCQPYGTSAVRNPGPCKPAYNYQWRHTKAVGAIRGTRILDVGCGEGWLSHELAEKYVTGFDVSLHLIEQATKKPNSNWGKFWRYSVMKNLWLTLELSGKTLTSWFVISPFPRDRLDENV